MVSSLSFDKCVDEFAERVYNHAYRMLGSQEDAEDATQEVFIRVYRGLMNFRGEAQVSTWIWRITTNVCLSYRARRKEYIVPLDDHNLEETLADDSETSNPESKLSKKEESERLASLIAELNHIEAAAVSMFYLQEMSYEEISAALSIPAGSVATALHRGREKLRKSFLQNERIQL